LFVNHTATLLPNGTVLLAGGTYYQGGIVLASALVYYPGSGKFTATAPMTGRRAWHAANLLPDGNVLMTGGNSTLSDGAAVATAEVFAPLTGTFRQIGNMTTNRSRHTSTLLNNGDVFIVGGIGRVGIRET
jgi:hypothetical protein